MRWPARSPDLSLLIFIYGGHMKKRVYDTSGDNAEELVSRIAVAVIFVSQSRHRRAYQLVGFIFIK